ncbi:MAG: hypothetical protein RLY20_3243 [Verrucomicrobiota bacterium]|jgi:hypothetical protein
MKRLLPWVAVTLASARLLDAATNPPSSPTDFGFAGKEIYPVDDYISFLRAADINGDGKMDLIVVNNLRSKIDILFNQTGVTHRPTAPAGIKHEINELPPDARFRIESVASEKRIASFVVADLNSDGRPDLAYYGEPKELIIQYNQGTNGWAAPKRWPIEDGILSDGALSYGDLNGDGRADLLLLAEKHIYFFAQKADGALVEPEKIPLSAPARAALTVDVNNDGRLDLLLVNWENASPFRVRLQSATGHLGPETYFDFPAIRSFAAERLTTNATTQIMTIALNSGRAQVSQFTKSPAAAMTEDFREGQFQILPLLNTDRSRRGMAWGDLNGDDLTDLLVAEPENGQITLYAQQADGSLAPPRSFPALAGISEIAAADWDNDKRAEVFLLSPDEKQMGVTRLDEKGRLPFPTLISLDGKPLAMAVGSMQSGLKPTLAVIVDKDGARMLVTRNADGSSHSQKLLASFKANPSALVWHDVDQDGLADLVVLIPYEKVKILRQLPGKTFAEIDVAPPGGVLEQPWLAAADVDGDGKAELLLAQKNFLRAVVLKREATSDGSTNQPGWGLHVRDQINGAASNSRITGAALVPGADRAALFLLDAERKALTVSQRDAAGVWQTVKSIPLPFSMVGTLQPIALGGAKPNSIALMSANLVAWQPLFGEKWALKQLDSYETPIKDGYLHDVVAGDLNRDGRKDLVFIETGKHYLDLVVFDQTEHLVPADRWPVYEERSLRSTRSELPEPREAVIADVTGDGRNDLIIVVHDRVLVYPQE